MITSTTLPLADLLKAGEYAPAKVQREYQWQTTQVSRLLEDLVGAFQRMGLDPGELGDTGDGSDDSGDDGDDGHSNPDGTGPSPPSTVARLKEPARQMPDAYYLGSLVLFKPGPSPKPKFQVYDGLQRLTSLNILLCVLRDTWRSIPAAGAAEIAAMLKTDAAKPERRLQFPTGAATLAELVEQRTLPNRDLTFGDIRMRDAISYFRAQFDHRWNSARRSAFLAFLQRDVHLTSIETSNHSVAYQMFVGANARGLSLNIGDVLKGLMADQVRASGGTVGQIQHCVHIWKTGQQTLRLAFDDYLHALEIYKFRSLPPVVATPLDESAPRLKVQRRRNICHTTGEKLQAFLSGQTDPAETRTWLNGEFTATVALFARLRSHETKPEASDLDRAHLQLSFLGWREWQSFYLALALQMPGGVQPDYLTRMRQLVRACYLIELLGWSESKRRLKFLRAIEHLEQGRDPFTYDGPTVLQRPGRDDRSLAFTQEEIQLAGRGLRLPLTEINKRGTIVRWLETLHWGPSVPQACYVQANVEHILPIGAGDEWSGLFSDEEREAWTNRLGNLCIIPARLNSGLGRSGWDRKQADYATIAGQFKGVNLVLNASAATLPDGDPRPWCAHRVALLSEHLATVAEQALNAP